MDHKKFESKNFSAVSVGSIFLESFRSFQRDRKGLWAAKLQAAKVGGLN